MTVYLELSAQIIYICQIRININTNIHYINTYIINNCVYCKSEFSVNVLVKNKLLSGISKYLQQLKKYFT